MGYNCCKSKNVKKNGKEVTSWKEYKHRRRWEESKITVRTSEIVRVNHAITYLCKKSILHVSWCRNIYYNFNDFF